MTQQYRILYLGYPSYRHLGSIERGLRTACGRLLTPEQFKHAELPGEVSCLTCQRTYEYRQAVASGQLVDTRPST